MFSINECARLSGPNDARVEAENPNAKSFDCIMVGGYGHLCEYDATGAHESLIQHREFCNRLLAWISQA